MNTIMPYHLAKRISMLLLSVFLLQLIIPLLSLVSIGVVKEIQKGKILNHKGNEELLSRITLTKEEYKTLQFIEKKEFIFNKVLYDIAYVKYENGHYNIFAIPDNIENFLQNLNNRILQKLVFYIKKSFHLFSLLYFESQGIHRPSDYVFIKMQLNYKNSFFVNPFLKTPYPPPKYIFI